MILFYSKSPEYGWLSNFTEHGFALGWGNHPFGVDSFPLYRSIPKAGSLDAIDCRRKHHVSRGDRRGHGAGSD